MTELPQKPDDGVGTEDEIVRAHLALARLQKSSGATVDWALAYAATGKPVFPCSPANKRPLTKHGFKDATTDPETIKGWWKHWPAAMIGMPTGAASNALVVDIDAKNEDNALALIEDLRKRIGGILPACWMVATPRGGMHLYFAMPPGVKLGNRAAMISTAAGQIDIRGEGGYVILPPSRRFGPQAEKDGCDGVAYAWSEECGIGDIESPQVPQGLIDLIRKDQPQEPVSENTATGRKSQKSAPRPAGNLAEARKRAYTLRVLNDEVLKLSGLSDGRNNYLNIVAMKLGKHVGAGRLSRSEVESALEAASHTNGEVKVKGLASVRATIRSGLEFGISQPLDLSHIGEDAARHAMRHSSSPQRPEPYGKPDTPAPPQQLSTGR